MSDQFDIYGDADTGDVSDAQGDGVGGRSAADTAGDGLPGVAVDGYPDLRAGDFGSGEGSLGLIRVSNPANARADGTMPPEYMADGHGGVQLRPGFADTHPKGPFDFGGMSKEIDWSGVAKDLGKIGAGVGASVALPFLPGLFGLGAAPAQAIGAAGSGALPNPWTTGASLLWRGARTLHNQRKANPQKADPVLRPDEDQV